MAVDRHVTVGEVQTLASAFRSIGLSPRQAAYLAKHDPGALPPHFTLARRRYVSRAAFEDWCRSKLIPSTLRTRNTRSEEPTASES
jgi:hypothetical protein